jgi:hypothetical protein
VADRLPRPLLAALGALDQARQLPKAAIGLPIMALTALHRARGSYDLLAARGLEVIEERFGREEPQDPPVPVLVAEAVVVQELLSHVEDPLDHPKGPEPIPGYDGMTLGALRGHLRTLTTEDLRRIAAYEQAHLHRQPMLTLVEHRLAKLALT